MNKISTSLFTFASIAFAGSFLFHRHDVWLALGVIGTGAVATMGWRDVRKEN